MSEKTVNTGTGFFGLLTLIFITLKLTHYVDWSWWWVLAPLWGTGMVILALAVIMTVAVSK